MEYPLFWNSRRSNTHKGDYGHALLVAGSYGKMGCAILASRACMRSGVGLLTAHVPEKGLTPLQCAVPEAMASIDHDGLLFSTPPTNLARYDASAVGPGIGTADRTFVALREFLCDWGDRPLVLDADAINIVALHPKEMMPLMGESTVLTPHDGEYERLFGDMPTAEAAAKHDIVIVRKGHRTKVHAPDGRLYENTTGNPGMATAGSGDVLTGIVLALLAQGLQPFEAACLGTYIHGKAGDIAAQKQSQASLMAGDIVENISSVK